MALMDPVFDTIDGFLAWISASLKQTAEAYCDLETADSPTVLVAHDGSLLSILKVNGVRALVGTPEFTQIQEGLAQAWQTSMSRPGHAIQVFFNYDREPINAHIEKALAPAIQTAEQLDLDLTDLFRERISHLGKYCAVEDVFIVLWTRPNLLSREQQQKGNKEKLKTIRENKIPPFRYNQNIIAPIQDLRETHDSFVRGTLNDLNTLNIFTELLEVHEAIYEIRKSVDPDFLDTDWRPVLPGDKVRVRELKKPTGHISDLLWPSLSQQIFARDAENMDLRTVRIGDKIYSSVFIDLFPKDIKSFITLFRRTLPTQIPWRISFFIESDGGASIKFKALLATILSFTSAQNRLLSDSAKLLDYVRLNTDDAVVRLRVAAATWAPSDNVRLLRTRTAELAKAIEGWGSCDVSEISGDPFAGTVSSMLGVTSNSVAPASVAAFSDVLYMLPTTRPASLWRTGALLLRSPDGKLWPFQPGSSEQTTHIDIIYARPGSGKSVLSNSINLALCLSAGIKRLPHIAIIDIGPSSSGLISLLRESLPADKRHLVAYHRLRMSADYAINPFDTQLGCRYPTPQERSFLVNFLTLLATPLGAERPYDGISDLAGMVVDELYKIFADDGNPAIYTPGIEILVDGILSEIGFLKDQRTTWWEVTDALFIAGFNHEAMLAQRYAMPLLADVTSVSRLPAVEDLYGNITSPTGETLINAFSRMVSGAVREYPVLSRVTSFDLGEARVVSLDLDEVAKSGGDAADRQTSVMYMLARYILARNYYLTDDNVDDMRQEYQSYHRERVSELREDPKRIVYDEFHRTAKSRAVREQVIVDMREGRKWKVQIALISQSVDDFDPVMIEFATSIYIMDAGPAQTIEKTAKIFGLSETAKVALRTRVHGPNADGATFLAQFATKGGMNTQLLTCTLGPIELWAFSTTPEDANVRNQLYKRLGAAETRRILANIFPNGTVTKVVEKRLNDIRDNKGLIAEEARNSVLELIVDEILVAYRQDPDIKRLPL
jgi:intracellular multiplication protein IcmB